MMRVGSRWIPLFGLVLMALPTEAVRAAESGLAPESGVFATQDDGRDTTARRGEKVAPDTAYVEPWGVAGRSLLLPGWGQFRLGDDAWGTSYLFSALLGAAFGLELVQFGSSENSRSFQKAVGWFQYGFSAVVSATMAYNAAEKRNRENGWLLEAGRGMDGGPLIAVTLRF